MEAIGTWYKGGFVPLTLHQSYSLNIIAHKGSLFQQLYLSSSSARGENQMRDMIVAAAEVDRDR